MRLLQAMAGAHHGGAEAFFERLAIGLHRAGVNQHLAIRQDRDRARLLRAAGLEVTELPFGGVFDFRTKPALHHIIREFESDIVLTWMNRATSFCPRGDFVHVARLGGYYDLKYYRHCDHLIGNTKGIVDYIRGHGWVPSRVHYLPNFVGAMRGETLPRAGFDVPEHAPLIFALGRLHVNKGFDVLLEALAKAPQFYLLLAGEGPERASLEECAQRMKISDRVRFLGWRGDIAALFATADLFVCPSRHEPLGNVVIEAWSAGVPVIAAASQGPREIVKNEENGLLVELENASALAEAMQRIVEDTQLRDRLIAAGKQTYENEFSEPRVIALYKEFFEKVMR